MEDGECDHIWRASRCRAEGFMLSQFSRILAKIGLLDLSNAGILLHSHEPGLSLFKERIFIISHLLCCEHVGNRVYLPGYIEG